MSTTRFLTTPQEVGEAVLLSRRAHKLTQTALARQAGVGRKFIIDLEAGHPGAELGKTLKVLDALAIYPAALPAEPVDNTPLENIDLDTVLARYG